MNKIAPNIFNGTESLNIGILSMHNHIGYPLKLTYTVIFICRKGEANVQINSKNYTVQPNDILILSEDLFVIFTSISADFQIYYCLIHRNLAEDIAYQLPNSLFSQLHYYPLYRPEHSYSVAINNWIVQLEHLFEYGQEYRQLMLKNHLQNFFLTVAEQTVKNTQSAQLKFSRKEFLCWKFWGLITTHSSQHRDVAFYAQQLCISPFYLSQIAKQFLNYSPKELINRQVILEIKALLSNTELPIKVIAEQLYFEDTSYLSRYFKQQTGMTLLEYRKK